MSDPRHIAIIMDGNGRWAKARGLPRAAGHRAGVEALRETVRAASDRGLGYLTLFAFSSENWSRPGEEVADLMGLLKLFIRRDLAELHRKNVRVSIIGERASLKADIADLLNEAETLTYRNSGLNLVIAFNYGSRDEIVRVVQKLGRDIAKGLLDPASISDALISANLDTSGMPDPDMIIRTSGEMRLSNFLLWQAAYSEFLFIAKHWPDFTSADLDAAYEAFRQRERRFGGVTPGGSGNRGDKVDVGVKKADETQDLADAAIDGALL